MGTPAQTTAPQLQTLDSIRRLYLNQQVTIIGQGSIIGNKDVCLQWSLAMYGGSRYDANELDFLPANYLGKSAKVIAIQPHDPKEAMRVNAVGDTVSIDSIPNPYFDVIVQFDDGKLAMTSAYPRTVWEQLRLATDEAKREQEMAKDLPLVVGRPLYAVGYSKLYKPDATLEQMTDSDATMNTLDVPLLEPLPIVAAKYIEPADEVVIEVRLPDGSQALSLTTSMDLGDQPERLGFLVKIAGTLITKIPATLTTREISSIRHGQIFKGMSKDAVEDCKGFPEQENYWEDGGTQLIFSNGSFYVYLDANDRVTDWQFLDK